MGTKIESAVGFAVGIANDDSHGYDKKNRWGMDYDCSALVITSFEQAGVPVKTNGAINTNTMREVFLATGFEEVIDSINLANGDGLVRGDVLLKEGYHTAIYIGDGQIVHASLNEKGTGEGGQPGDQTGKEICTRDYYNKPWNSVLRFKEDEPVATKSTDEIAREVLAGAWGSGTARKNSLEAAGYTYSEIQNRVNELMSGSSAPASTSYKVQIGDTLSAISKQYGVTIDSIVEGNRAKYPNISRNFIVVGWVLDIR